jgi:hypothetical protein
LIHYVPPNDEAEHFTDDMIRRCPCEPEIRTDAYNNVVCLHRAYDMRHLIQQAEDIRIHTSIKLWEEVQKMTIIIPIKEHLFDAGQGAVIMPQSVQRKQLEDHDEEEYA